MENVTNSDNEKWMKEIWNWADEEELDDNVIPRESEKLIMLEELHLCHENSVNIVSESIGNLKNLKIFELENCGEGLPENIGDLSNLTKLMIHNNYNLESLPESIGQLSNLETLYIESNSYLKSIPESIGKLSSLVSLTIQSNSDLESIPESIGQLLKLSTLKIEYNCKIESISESISQLSNLVSLNISDNENIRSITTDIGFLSKLTELNLSRNKLSLLPESIGQLLDLTELYVSDNEISVLPETIGNLIKLEYFELDSNKLKSLPESITSMENLKSITIYNNPLKNMSKPIVDFLQNLGVSFDEVDESDSSTSSTSNDNNTSTFLQVNGYGVETFAGTVEAATYQYFEDNDIDLEDYSNDAEWGDDNCQVPEEHNFGGGGLYEVDNLWHVNGAYLTEDTQIELVNGSEDTIWSSNCDTESLESQGIKLICVSSQEDIFDSLDLKTVVMIGRIFQQGCTFENQLQDIENFDPNNLTIYYHEDESGRIIKKIEYDDTELENGDSSTSGSGSEYFWEVIG